MILGIDKFKLVYDRTNWKLGKTNINFLVLGVLYSGYVIPLFINLLPKTGNSNFEERKSLLQRFLQVFGIGMIEMVLADRGFISKEWFDYLVSQQIDFCIRIKKNMLVDGKQAGRLFYHLKPGEIAPTKGKRKILDNELYLAAGMSESGQFVLVVSTREENILMEYKLRWRYAFAWHTWSIKYTVVRYTD